MLVSQQVGVGRGGPAGAALGEPLKQDLAGEVHQAGRAWPPMTIHRLPRSTSSLSLAGPLATCRETHPRMWPAYLRLRQQT